VRGGLLLQKCCTNCTNCTDYSQPVQLVQLVQWFRKGEATGCQLRFSAETGYNLLPKVNLQLEWSNAQGPPVEPAVNLHEGTAPTMGLSFQDCRKRMTASRDHSYPSWRGAFPTRQQHVHRLNGPD
jgi:hypothetical protein